MVNSNQKSPAECVSAKACALIRLTTCHYLYLWKVMFMLKLLVSFSFTFLSFWIVKFNLRCCSTVVRLDGSVPVKYGLRLPMDATYLLLKERLAALCQLSSDHILLAEVSGNMIKVGFSQSINTFISLFTTLFYFRAFQGPAIKFALRQASPYSLTKCWTRPRLCNFHRCKLAPMVAKMPPNRRPTNLAIFQLTKQGNIFKPKEETPIARR